MLKKLVALLLVFGTIGLMGSQSNNDLAEARALYRQSLQQYGGQQGLKDELQRKAQENRALQLLLQAKSARYTLPRASSRVEATAALLARQPHPFNHVGSAQALYRRS